MKETVGCRRKVLRRSLAWFRNISIQRPVLLVVFSLIISFVLVVEGLAESHRPEDACIKMASRHGELHEAKVSGYRNIIVPTSNGYMLIIIANYISGPPPLSETISEIQQQSDSKAKEIGDLYKSGLGAFGHRQYLLSVNLFKRAMEKVQTPSLHIALSVSYFRINYFREAVEHARKALNNLAPLEAKKPTAMQARALDALADAQSGLLAKKKAANNYQGALSIWRKLAKKSPARYRPVVAASCNNLGALLLNQGALLKGKKYFEEAYWIYINLWDRESFAFLPEVSMILNNKGVSLVLMNDRASNLSLFKDALRIYRKMSSKLSKAYLPPEAVSCNNLGAMMSETSMVFPEIIDRDQARLYLDKALSILGKLAKKEPDIYLASLAGTFNNIGLLLTLIGDRKKAVEHYEKSLVIYRKLSTKEPKIHGPNLMRTCLNYAKLLQAMGKLDQASDLRSEAMDMGVRVRAK